MAIHATLPSPHAPSPLPPTFAVPVLGLLGPCWAEDYLPPLPLIFLDGAGRCRQLPYYPSSPETAAGPGPYPQFLLGDGDSFPEGYAEFDIQLCPDKDFSDLAYALAILPATVQHLHLYGLRGGRRDHELAVLGEIDQLLQTALNLQVHAEDFTALAAGHHIFNFTGRFSILSLRPNRLQLTGHLKYPLKQPTVLRPLHSHGISNEASGRWEIEATWPFFLFHSPEGPWPHQQ